MDNNACLLIITLNAGLKYIQHSWAREKTGSFRVRDEVDLQSAASLSTFMYSPYSAWVLILMCTCKALTPTELFLPCLMTCSIVLDHSMHLSFVWCVPYRSASNSLLPCGLYPWPDHTYFLSFTTAPVEMIFIPAEWVLHHARERIWLRPGRGRSRGGSCA